MLNEEERRVLFVAMTRAKNLLFPNVLFEPPTVFKAGRPDAIRPTKPVAGFTPWTWVSRPWEGDVARPRCWRKKSSREPPNRSSAPPARTEGAMKSPVPSVRRRSAYGTPTTPASCPRER